MPEVLTETLTGKDLNFAIAERVMGWTRGNRYGNGNGEWVVPGRDSKMPLTWSQTPRFSESIDAAMQIVEKMWQIGWQMEAANGYKPNSLVVDNLCSWYVRFINNENDMENWSAEAETLPEAICRAALRAIE